MIGFYRSFLPGMMMIGFWYPEDLFELVTFLLTSALEFV
jgi:hypothetical protein